MLVDFGMSFDHAANQTRDLWSALRQTAGISLASSGGSVVSDGLVGQPLVAHQVNDLGLQLNSGFFRLNGSCGYVLKPKWQRDPGASLGKVLAEGSG